MPFGITHFFAGANEDNYKASIAQVHPSDGSLPSGQIFHAAGATEGGWLIVAIFDAKSSWETFRDDTLSPKMTAGIDGGFAAPPEEREFNVSTMLP